MINNKLDNSKLGIIQALRGLAALAVCLFHFTQGDMKFLGTTKMFESFWSKGWLGVEVFFVISGFIIPYSLVKSNYTIRSYGKFILKRLLRIEPPFLISILLVIILGYISTLVPGYRGQPFRFDYMQISSHLLYLTEHFDLSWLQPVYWSLEIEFHYYLLIGIMMPFFFRNELFFSIIMAVLLILGQCVQFTFFEFSGFFCFGITAAAFKLQKITNKTFWIFFVIIIISMWHDKQEVLMISTGILTALIIVFVEFKSKITEFLGTISFSLYLVHVPIGGRIINFGGRFADRDWKVWIVLIVAIAVSILFAWIFYKLVEKPSLRLANKYNGN